MCMMPFIELQKISELSFECMFGLLRSAHTRGLVVGTSCRDKFAEEFTRWDYVAGTSPL